jgi:dTDP-4-dehydrorhamnose reductase
VAGGDCVSKYEFGAQLARTFDLDPGRIERASVEAGGLRAPRGRRLCLAGHKIEAALGVRLPGVRDGLARFKALRERGRPDELRQLAGSGTLAREGAEG